MHIEDVKRFAKHEKELETLGYIENTLLWNLA